MTMKKALLLLLMGFMIASCGKKDPMADTKAKNITAFKGFDSLMQSGNLTGIEKYVAADYVEHNPMPGAKPGIEGLKEMAKMMRSSMPDAKWTYSSIWADGDYVIGHYEMSGTMTGDMGPMKATGKKMEGIGGVDIVKFKDGIGVEHWGYWDQEKMMKQLGMMPPPPEAAAPPTTDATAPEAKK